MLVLKGEMQKMLNPKQKRYADRLRQLIVEGNSVALLESPSGVGPYIKDRSNYSAR
jgi:hypothetical protein